MPKNKIIPYNPNLKQLAQELRKNSTMSEVILWKAIKGRQLGIEFHRQVPIDEYIVDFYCHELMLAIEIDGASHFTTDAEKNDLKRQQRLENLGVHFLRFYDADVKENLHGVLITIEQWIDKLSR
jgi:very-short-patch-repair endonuclease